MSNQNNLPNHHVNDEHDENESSDGKCHKFAEDLMNNQF